MIIAEGILTAHLTSLLPDLAGKIKPVDEALSTPLLIYEVSEQDAMYTNSAPDLWVYDVAITLIEANYSAVKRLANRVQAACRTLEGTSGAGYKVVFARDFAASTDNDKEILGFTTTITFTLTIEEVNP